ncbi:unnamed protein product, partial [Meganyctiphanes norvegica]
MLLVPLSRMMLTVQPTHLVFLLVFLSGSRGYQDDLVLVDHGYEGLVVAISDKVPQQSCNDVLSGLKNVLEEFSQQLFTTTSGMAYLRDVTVALPSSWKMDPMSCSPWAPLVATATPINGHIHVTAAPHPLFGSQPWVQQSQGCGHPGDYIQLGSDLLRATSTNASVTRAAKLLVREWTKFRWGIFDEGGHHDDPLYPLTISDPVTNAERPNTCHNKSNHGAFCSMEDHTPEAPNKHNALCDGRPAWDIISKSKDFSNQRSAGSNSTNIIPTFKFIKPALPHIVLIVEDTAVMNLQRRWEFIRKAVRRLIVYDIPDDTHIGVVVFNSVATTVAPVSQMDSESDVRELVGSSLPRNPSRIPESHKCLLCGLQEAVRVLDDVAGGMQGGTIILLTTGTGNTPEEEMNEIIQLTLQKSLKIEVILYPMSESHGSIRADSRLQSLAARSHGSTLTVMDEGVGNDSKLYMMASLMDALLATMRHSYPLSSSNVPLVVHSQSYPGGIESIAKGSFTLDESFGPDARFAIYYYDLNHVGNKIQLVTPSGKNMSSVNIQKEDGDANAIFVNILQAERGKWSYQLENRATSHQGLHIQVTSTENNKQHISVQVWTSKSSSNNNHTNISLPVIIYAELKDDDVPILNARVVAKLKRLGTNITGSNFTPLYIDLFDNGFGDPDITKGDGVYSRYLSNLPHLPGQSSHYELSVFADDNNKQASKPIQNPNLFKPNKELVCCGSRVNFENVVTVPSFQRSEVYGVLHMKNDADNKDIFPPNRILDLQAAVNITSLVVTLQWTAPGDDYDWGRANNYEAVLATSWSDALLFIGEDIGGLPVPLSVGTEQSVEVIIEHYEQTLYIALKAKDEANNYGNSSNVVSIWIPLPPTTTISPTSTESSISAGIHSEPLGHGLTQPVRVAGFNFSDMSVIIGIVAGFVLVIFIIALICFVSVVRSKKRTQEQNNKKIKISNSGFAKHGSVDMEVDGSQDSIDSTVKDSEAISKKGRSISPTYSWTPSKLLQEHEQRISITSGPTTDSSDYLPHYQTLHDNFPDVTLTGSCTSSQTPVTTRSDPPAYQVAYNVEEYPAHPYSYNPSYSHEELPPYTPQGPSSQSSQASTSYIHELNSQPIGLPYQQDNNSYTYGIEDTNVPTLMYTTYPNDHSHDSPAPKSKTGPPVAQKPHVGPIMSGSNMAFEPKRRNVTQV